VTQLIILFAGQVALDLELPTLKTVLVELSKRAGLAILTGKGSEEVNDEKSRSTLTGPSMSICQRG
jgi:hypothetical protein